MSRIKSSSAIEAFVERVNKEIREYFETNESTNSDFYKENPGHIPVLEISYGSKYAKLISVSTGSRAAWGFVNIETRELFKASSWTAPAKHARGNIETAEFGKNYFWTGPNYLR